jgi:hypothetical protein
MSVSPNNSNANTQPQSPPSEVTNTKIIPLPVIHQQDEIFYYIFVKGSLYASDAHVFGLETAEIQALSKRFNSAIKQVENGVMILHPVGQVINSLAQLGYRVVSSCGDAETIFTMQREV